MLSEGRAEICVVQRTCTNDLDFNSHKIFYEYCMGLVSVPGPLDFSLYSFSTSSAQSIYLFDIYLFLFLFFMNSLDYYLPVSIAFRSLHALHNHDPLFQHLLYPFPFTICCDKVSFLRRSSHGTSRTFCFRRSRPVCFKSRPGGDFQRLIF